MTAMFEYPLHTTNTNIDGDIWDYGYVEDEGPKPPPPSNLLVALVKRVDAKKEAEQ